MNKDNFAVIDYSESFVFKFKNKDVLANVFVNYKGENRAMFFEKKVDNSAYAAHEASIYNNVKFRFKR